MGACGSTLMKPCLSETDVRYDANFPTDILEMDPRWERLTGFFLLNISQFDAENPGLAQPGPYIPGVAPTAISPFDQQTVAFYNHTVDGSRLIINRYYFRKPAPMEFCMVPFQPPLMNAPPGYTCGENGHAIFASIYGALNHEHDGTVSLARAAGAYGSLDGVLNPGADSMARLSDGNTFELNFNVEDIFSGIVSLVFFDNDTATVNAVHTDVPRKSISSANTGRMVRLTESEFLAGIDEYNEKYNVPEAMRVQSPMTSDEVPSIAGKFPTEEEWCGGLVNDVSCTVSPYQEPPAQMKNGFIALFVVLGVLVLGTIGYLLYRKKIEEQKQRYKLHFVRGIARNITVAESAGMISPEQLKKEFDHIDSDCGGTISKDELKKFVASGKVGTIKDKDFEALWHAIDIDDSGEVDFVEFLTFLGGCGAQFDTASKEQSAMTKEDKIKFASQRLSVIQMSKADAAALAED